MATHWCLSTLQRIDSDLSLYEGGRRIGLDVLDAYQVQLEQVYRELMCIELMNGLNDQVLVGVDLVREALRVLQNMVESREHLEMGYCAPVTHTPERGRPPFLIPRNQLAFLLETRFTVPQIAGILGVSVRTIRRRMSEYGLSVHSLYTQLSDQELDEIVSDIQTLFPTCGNRQMQGHLLSRGIRVQQGRVRDSQRRIDPSGSMLRRLRVINRRQYQVDGPLALWHIDGNHKLIR